MTQGLGGIGGHARSASVPMPDELYFKCQRPMLLDPRRCLVEPMILGSVHRVTLAM